jgi:hypothetical protein
MSYCYAHTSITLLLGRAYFDSELVASYTNATCLYAQDQRGGGEQFSFGTRLILDHNARASGIIQL